MFFNKSAQTKKSSKIDSFVAKKEKDEYVRLKRINVIFSSVPIAIMYQLSTMTAELRAEVGVFGTAISLSASVLVTLLYIYAMTNLAGGVISSSVNRYLKSNSIKSKNEDSFLFSREMAQYTASRICAITAMLSFLICSTVYTFTGMVSVILMPLLVAVSVYEIKKETGVKLSQSFFSTMFYLLAVLISTAILSLVFVYGIMFLSASPIR